MIKITSLTILSASPSSGDEGGFQDQGRAGHNASSWPAY